MDPGYKIQAFCKSDGHISMAKVFYVVVVMPSGSRQSNFLKFCHLVISENCQQKAIEQFENDIEDNLVNEEMKIIDGFHSSTHQWVFCACLTSALTAFNQNWSMSKRRGNV
jgi:hypothetical protein